VSPEQAVAQALEQFREEQRELEMDERRLLIARVAAIERRWGVASVCRTCAGCENCERLHRAQDVVQYARKGHSRSGYRPSSN
jgi:hypothetical protein